MLAASTLITITVAGEAKGVLTASDVLAGVVSELGNIPLHVSASSIDAGNPVWNAITFQWLHYNYRAMVTVSTPADTYDDVSGVADNVAQAFEDVAGSTPTAVQAAIVGQQPAIDKPAGSSILPDLGLAISSNVHGLLLIVVALVVLFVITIGWGKNISALAASR